MKSNTVRYEYYALRSILLLYVSVECIGLCFFLGGYVTQVMILWIVGVLIIGFGWYLLLANIFAMYSLYKESEKNTEILQRIVDALHLHGNETILDIGCGRGRISILLGKKLTNGMVIGIDRQDVTQTSSNVIKIARMNATIEEVSEKMSFISGNVLTIPVKDNEVDLVTCAGVLNHLKVKDRNRALHEVSRVLREQGTFLLFEMVRGLRGFFIYTPFKFFKLKNKNEWKSIIESDGFSLINSFADRGRVVFIFKKHQENNPTIVFGSGNQ